LSSISTIYSELVSLGFKKDETSQIRTTLTLIFQDSRPITTSENEPIDFSILENKPTNIYLRQREKNEDYTHPNYL